MVITMDIMDHGDITSSRSKSMVERYLVVFGRGLESLHAVPCNLGRYQVPEPLFVDRH